MNTHIETLEQQADRGVHRGADILIRDISESLSDPQSVTLVPLRREPKMPGPVWAFAAAGLVVVVGLVSSLILGPPRSVSQSEIVWHEMAASAPAGRVVSGPGGFGRAEVFGQFFFSADGLTWTRVTILDPLDDLSVVATTKLWFALSKDDGDQLGWISEDGRTWTSLQNLPGAPGTVQQAVATPDHVYLVTRDVFGEGTQLWRSDDAKVWVEMPAGPATGADGLLSGTSGGLVLYRGSDISVSTDGARWTSASLEAPAGLGEGRVLIEGVGRADDRWVAFVSVQRIGQDPVLALLSSVNGEVWELDGIPPFGQVEGSAPGVVAMWTMGDRLMVVPSITPAVRKDDGFVIAEGRVRSPGQIWSLRDRSEWRMDLNVDQDIVFANGAEIEGRLIGVWAGFPVEALDQDTPVVTTTPMPDDPLDPDGLEFQASVIEDGRVTFEEFEQAFEHWKSCMEERGVTDVEYTIGPSGDHGMSFASPSPSGEAEELIANFCYASWVDQVASALGGQ